MEVFMDITRMDITRMDGDDVYGCIAAAMEYKLPNGKLLTWVKFFKDGDIVVIPQECEYCPYYLNGFYVAWKYIGKEPIYVSKNALQKSYFYAFRGRMPRTKSEKACILPDNYRDFCPDSYHSTHRSSFDMVKMFDLSVIYIFFGDDRGMKERCAYVCASDEQIAEAQRIVKERTVAKEVAEREKLLQPKKLSRKEKKRRKKIEGNF